ncbi:MAG TPA: 4Fe-4S single cluster domain-containing protein [Kofleriaceae bacterium]|nr:4Fe-4S single cluster domain-containing protein [Kofleriaceae bacterium]
MLRVATIIDETEAEGPGRRLALWVQGCTIQCPGCCNPEMFRPDRGTVMTADELGARLDRMHGQIEGISVLGGEPFEQPAGVLALVHAARQRGLTVMVYSGYTLAELRARPEPEVGELLAAIDLLVDGRYDRNHPEPPPPLGRRWIGSTNQTVHYLSAAYTPDDPQMHTANTVEVHWQDGKLLINGWPAGAAALAKLTRRS